MPSPLSHWLGNPRSHPAESGGSCNEAAAFASCYGLAVLLALLGQGFYNRAYTGRVAPSRVGYDWMAHRHLPSPDLHRLDWQPYGLQTKIDKSPPTTPNPEYTKFEDVKAFVAFHAEKAGMPQAGFASFMGLTATTHPDLAKTHVETVAKLRKGEGSIPEYLKSLHKGSVLPLGTTKDAAR